MQQKCAVKVLNLKKLQVLCHRNVLHARMRLTFVRTTCTIPYLLNPPSAHAFLDALASLDFTLVSERVSK